MIPYAVNFLVTLAWGSIPWVHCLAACSKVHSTHDAAVAITDMAAASMLPRQLVEQANTLAESGARLSNNANRQQFHVALLEDCSFFAHLVLIGSRFSAEEIERNKGLANAASVKF